MGTDDDAIRAFARDIGVNPPLLGFADVQSVLTAIGAGGPGDSRLSATPTGTPDISSGTVNLPWTLDVGAGTDLSIDAVDSTKIHFAIGTYLIQYFAQVSATHATSATLPSPTVVSGNIDGNDGSRQGQTFNAGAAIAREPARVLWIRCTVATILQFSVTAAAAGAGDTVLNGGIDIVRIA